MLRNTLSDHLRKVRKAEGGFTLIEMLIVIVVLGILAGIVVFGVATFKSDSEAAAKKADCKTVSVAAEAYVAKNGGAYPTVATLVTDNYLKSAPAGVGPGIAANGTPAGCP